MPNILGGRWLDIFLKTWVIFFEYNCSLWVENEGNWDNHMILRRHPPPSIPGPPDVNNLILTGEHIQSASVAEQNFSFVLVIPS